MNEVVQKSLIAAAALPCAIDLVRDLRTAAALARDGDWRRLGTLFDGHPWPPLAALAQAARDALLSLPAHLTGPGQILSLAEPNDVPIVADLLAAFGNPA